MSKRSEYEQITQRGWAVDYARQCNKRGAPVKKILKDAAQIMQFMETGKSGGAVLSIVDKKAETK